MADEYYCPHCHGTEKIELTGVYADTLMKLRMICFARGLDNYVVANRDYKAFRCSPTALNNRLSRLEEIGLLASVKFGRQRRFSPAWKGKKP